MILYYYIIDSEVIHMDHCWDCEGLGIPVDIVVNPFMGFLSEAAACEPWDFPNWLWINTY